MCSSPSLAPPAPYGPRGSLKLELPDEAATLALGRLLAPLLTPGMVVWLDGDLGAGKTTLVRALLRARGYNGTVRSPTYTLVELYTVSRIYWYHFDFYRFNDPEEFLDAGLDEYFRSDAVCLVEWPGKAAGFVPPADLALHLCFPAKATDRGRSVDLSACSERGSSCLNVLAESAFRGDA
ncbi:MAG: tRNA (adenosine(37)-N6)-threonylcarbamoyltransferase complex ATPase subunit type 1 TsaE [Candidatus Accumulibacter sp.]|jgi:tRNA threonylcarbamoyladenosine biosynthesis protein TsaE|nr:tRNA (adenosine(37)-N6)-threonylcarbamoyltransferase complex ATPase subunit type 1 TsaE [Accumulibacter sp.]